MEDKWARASGWLSPNSTFWHGMPRILRNLNLVLVLQGIGKVFFCQGWRIECALHTILLVKYIIL